MHKNLTGGCKTELIASALSGPNPGKKSKRAKKVEINDWKFVFYFNLNPSFFQPQNMDFYKVLELSNLKKTGFGVTEPRRWVY